MEILLYVLAAVFILALTSRFLSSWLESGLALILIGWLISYHWKISIWDWAAKPFIWLAKQFF